MWWLAKTVQAMCIVTLLYALYVGVAQEDVSRELMIMALGGAAFLAARRLEKHTA